MTSHPRYRLTLAARPSGIPPAQRARRALKVLLRAFDLTCERFEELPADPPAEPATKIRTPTILCRGWKCPSATGPPVAALQKGNLMNDVQQSLPDLAERINEEHRLCEQSFRSGLMHAHNAGNLLLEAKDHCGHGNWLPWLRDNCRASERTAQAYMRI